MLRRWLRVLLVVVLLLGAATLGLVALGRAARLPELPVPPRASAELRHVTLVNPGVAGGRHEAVRIRIEGGHVTAIEPDPLVDGAAAGGFVLPGLIDMHVHSPIFPADEPLWATLFLLHGVTTVRNMGDGKQSLHRKPLVAAGREAGPRIFACGMILDGPGGGFPARTLRTRADAEAAVAELGNEGADCIKVMPHLSEETFTALRAAAGARGLPVVGHMVNAYGDRGLEAAGIVDVQHLTGIPLGPSPGMHADEWQRFRGDFRAASAPRIAHGIEVSRRLGIHHTPTLVGVAYEAFGATGTGPAPHPELLPSWYQSSWTALDRSIEPERQALAASFGRYLEIVKALHDAGVPVQAGSDVFPFIPYVAPGAGLHDELRLFVQAGFSPEEALAAATTVPGAALAGNGRAEKGIGTVTVGAPADLIIYRQDPSRSLAALNSIETVFADGRRYDRGPLHQHLTVQLDASRRFPYSVLGRIVAWLISRFA